MRRWMWSMLWLAGCGIPGNTLLADLEPEDRANLCEKEEEETFTCEVEGFSLPIAFGGETCEDDLVVVDDCDATVRDWHACNAAWREALADDPCADMPDACEWLLPCSGFSG